MQPTAIPQYVIWCVMDGKPGHQNQSLGLAEAIGRQQSVQICEIPLQPPMRGWRALLPGAVASFRSLPKPDLILGAGHGTHLPVIQLRRRYGGRTVVLMRPSLPSRCFDLCLIPDAHQLQNPTDQMIITQGVLNRVVRSNQKDHRHGLILIGGPSKHFQWSDDEVISQVSNVVRRSGDITWTIGSSRRTPSSWLQGWKQSGLPTNLVLAEDAPSDWLLQQYSRAGTIWVTEDSVSMTYEAVTSGSRVGLIELTATAENRVTRSIHALAALAYVVRYSAWDSSLPIPVCRVPLAEADRCARIVIAKLAAQPRSKMQAA